MKTTDPYSLRIQLATVVRLVCRCLLVIAPLFAIGGVPNVSRMEVSESESPVQQEGESLELALPGAAKHVTKRRQKSTDDPKIRHAHFKLTNSAIYSVCGFSGHRWSNGLLAPIRC